MEEFKSEWWNCFTCLFLPRLAANDWIALRSPVVDNPLGTTWTINNSFSVMPMVNNVWVRSLSCWPEYDNIIRSGDKFGIPISWQDKARKSDIVISGSASTVIGSLSSRTKTNFMLLLWKLLTIKLIIQNIRMAVKREEQRMIKKKVIIQKLRDIPSLKIYKLLNLVNWKNKKNENIIVILKYKLYSNWL